MTDVSKAIEPKSDQLNNDDLIAGPMTGKITGVDVRATGEQLISVMLDCWHRPWKPCKSMARLMASVWGKDSSAWVGHSITLFSDPSVRWAGVEVGGIRVQAMSGIDKPTTINLTVTRGKRKPFTVQPLQCGALVQQPNQQQQQPAPQQTANDIVDQVKHYGKTLNDAATMEDLVSAWGKIPTAIKPELTVLKDQRKELLSNPQPQSEPVTQVEDGIENF